MPFDYNQKPQMGSMGGDELHLDSWELSLIALYCLIEDILCVSSEFLWYLGLYSSDLSSRK